MERAAALAASTSYDIAVLTGDYRAATYGAYDTTLEGLARLRPHLKGPVYGVLGNHDSIRMVPGMEAMGIRMLLNEFEDDPPRRSGDPSRRHRRRRLLRRRQYPEGGRGNPPWRLRDPALPYAGGLSPGRPCRVPSDAERPYPWRPDLPARGLRPHPRCRRCRAVTAPGPGCMRGWRAIPPPARVPPSSPCASIARRRSRCTTCGEVSGAKEPRSNPRPQRQPHPAAADQPAPSSGHGRTARYAP